MSPRCTACGISHAAAARHCSPDKCPDRTGPPATELHSKVLLMHHSCNGLPLVSKPPTGDCQACSRLQGWGLLQVDTFEAVKNNVYNMLGDLAQNFDGKQMDLLFTKFEGAHTWAVADTLKVMDLVAKLALADDKARPALPVVVVVCRWCWFPGLWLSSWSSRRPGQAAACMCADAERAVAAC